MPEDRPESDQPEQGTELAENAEPKAAEPKAAEPKAAEPSTTGANADVAPRKKKKKKKKRKTELDQAPPNEKAQGPVVGPEGWERPLFVLDFPSDPELDRLVRAFELGNYAHVRAHAGELAERTNDPRVREAAAELMRRIEPDPLVRILLGLSIALFLFMVFYAYETHGH